MTPMWKNGGAQLNAYDRDMSGVVGAITLSYPNGVNMRPTATSVPSPPTPGNQALT